jgi:predicted amidophosphoribosyltransferase
MRWVLPGGATLEGTDAGGDDRRVACRPLAAVLVRTIHVSLFPCPDCQRTISTKEETCPHCGRPVDSIELPAPTPRRPPRLSR